MPLPYLFEFEDQRWFPHVIRQGMMDYLRHMIEWSEFYKPCAPVIKSILQKNNTTCVVDLCAGGGGGTMKMLDYLNEIDCSPKITLTDLYPNLSTWSALKSSSPQVDFYSASVNALHVPENLNGLRIMYSALHHFKPVQVKAMLRDAMKKKAPVAFFDAGTTSILNIAGVILIEPITFILLTPFFKPFRWGRIFFTYIVPLIILCTLWDGSVSVLRFYSLKELQSIAEELNQQDDYVWQAGQVKNKLGIKVNFITGSPVI